MRLRNKFLVVTIFLFFLIISSGIVFADDSALPNVENGQVSGGVEIPSVNPFSSQITSGELVYTIPANVSEIKSVNVVVSSYSGSGAANYGLTTNISLKIGNNIYVLEYANLTYPVGTANDPVIYPITNHTSKQYSDYQTLINISDKVKGLSPGDTITISVNNTQLDGYSFDGRIKLIALTFAYDDGDNDKISYWLNIGQAWTKETLTTVFRTKDFDDDYDDVTLESIALSSADASYKLNGELIFNPVQTKGDYYIYDIWNITDNFKLSNDTNFTYTSSKASQYASYKGVIQLLKINSPEKYFVSATVAPEYGYKPLSIYAGVNNTLTITVNNGIKDLNGSVKLLIGDVEVASSDLFVAANDVATIRLVDPTIRPINETTVNGVNNTVVNYTLNILNNKGEILNSTNVSYIVVYNGYLGKDYEYPNANPTLREFTISGDVIVLNAGAYSAGGATSRSDVFNVEFNGSVSEALLYVSYNWDKNLNGDFNYWNTTFNGQLIAPIASYRDQSNLGSSAKYGYGLVVYNVTNLVVAGDNTFELNKTSGNAAVYPSNLIVLTNNDGTYLKKSVYILEEADLLYKNYNKNLPTGFNTTFSVVDGNATLFVFAASAQSGEGNLIINGETYSNVWSGTSNSFDTFITDVNSTDLSIYFESIGGTILGLHQMVVVENQISAAEISVKPEYTGTVYAGVVNNLTITVKNPGKSTKDVVVRLLIGDDEVGNYTISDYNEGETYILNIVDSTIRPITENTVNGNNNEKVNYTVVVEDDGGNVLNSTNVSYVLLYNGYLGKDYEYPNANPTLREFTISGDVIVLNAGAYSAGGATTRTDVFNVEFNGSVSEALLYVSYNWDKNPNDDFNYWNTTFNGQLIAPIASYRDQSNLGGSSAKYGYGLVVYNVTNLVVAGDNTFELNKTSGNAAVYPSNLIVLTNNNESNLVKSVYILEEADLLYKNYNKNLPTGFNTTFSVVDGNATLFVFAASAQSGEGNLIINGETYSNVWSGTSNSFDTFITDVNSTDLSIYFESTGGTILGLHQMVVVENQLPKKDLTLNVTEFSIGGNSTIIIVRGFENATGNVTVTIGDNNYTSSIMMGMAFVSVPKLNETVTAYIYYPGDDKYNNVSATVEIIPKKDLNLTASADPIYVGQNATIIVTGFEDATGNVAMIVGSGFYNATIIDGTAIVNIPGLNKTTTAYVLYMGDDKYNMAVTYVNITVNEKPEFIIDAPDVTKYYGGSERFVVTVKDADGNPIADQPVSIEINGVTYNRATNANGTTSIPLGLESGNYTVTVTANNTTVTSNVDILSTVSADNLVKVYKNESQYYATFLDTQGNPLAAGTEVTFNINGVMYTRKTNENGTAKLNINLDQGTFIITATNSVTGEKHSNNITVLSRIVDNKDLVKYYKNASQYVVTLIGDDGNPVGAGETVTFNINGVFYTRTTNATGQAKLNINLDPGVYVITAEYKGCRVSNTVTVKPVLSASDLTKKYGTPDQFVATLLDGQGNPVDGEIVTFNINGVLYNRTTRDGGKAPLNINLQPGEYIITSSYNGTSISNTIKVEA